MGAAEHYLPFRGHLLKYKSPFLVTFRCDVVGESVCATLVSARGRADMLRTDCIMVVMRIIAGRFKGFELTTPKSGTRPTTDRAKEAIFSHLLSIGIIDDARVLDLFAGSGALGIEALSRGAQSLVAVESAGQAASMLGKTLTRLRHSKAWDAAMSARMVKAKAEKFASAPNGTFDLIFIDPPYAFATESCNELLRNLVGQGLADPRGVIMLERSARSDDPVAPTGWEITQTRQYGETAVFYFERELEDSAEIEQSEESDDSDDSGNQPTAEGNA